MLHSHVSCLFLVLPVITTAYNCQQGCFLDLGALATVCDDNGIRYDNECLAVCQGVTEVTSCVWERAGESLGSLLNRRQESRGFIPAATLSRFSGYNLIAKVAFGPSSESGNLQTQRIESSNNMRSGERSLKSIIITNDGYEYISVEDTLSEDPPSVIDQPGHRGSTSSNTRQRELRNLTVFGSESRYEVSSPDEYPWSVVGQLTLNDGSSCTGTIISNDSIVTAAHCVYGQGAFKQISNFAPGRNGNPDGSYYNPFGTWSWDYTTIYLNYMDTESSDWDMAVVKLQPKFNGKLIGDEAGYSGYRYIDNANDSTYLSSVEIVGYPSDKTFGSMWSSGTCADSYFGRNTYGVGYLCDTVGGMEGAALLHGLHRDDKDVRVQGLHLEDGSQANYGILLTGHHYYAIQEWSGRGKHSNPATPPSCSSNNNNCNPHPGTPKPTPHPTPVSHPPPKPTPHPTPRSPDHPTSEPTPHPTKHAYNPPTPHPTIHPTRKPTRLPTTNHPTLKPTPHPTNPTHTPPTRQPIPQPTSHPTAHTVNSPTPHPTNPGRTTPPEPTDETVDSPTPQPTDPARTTPPEPTEQNINAPTPQPTNPARTTPPEPTYEPTLHPTDENGCYRNSEDCLGEYLMHKNIFGSFCFEMCVSPFFFFRIFDQILNFECGSC